MKLNPIILTVFLLSLSCYSFSQETDRILPDTLQSAISGQWKYQLGDNPLWASEEFDDSKWNTTIFSNSFKDSIPAGHQILWFRLTIPAAVVKNDSLLAIVIEQFGATEIYVNSKLVKQLGRIITPQRFSYYNPHRSPIPVILKSEQQNILAIRFATDMPGSEWIISRLNVPPLSVKLQDFNVVLAESEAAVGEKRVQTGISFITGIFGFLFLLIFLFYPREKLNLFFALFNLFLLINAVSINFMETGHFNLNVRALFTPGLNLISRLIGMSLLLFMLYALNKMRPFFWWYIGWVILVDFPLTLILPVEYMNVSQALRTSIIPISLWLMYHSFKSSRKEDILIGFVAFTMILVNVSFLITRFTEFDFSGIITKVAPAMFYLITIFYLAIRYTKTNKSLEHQLKQVQLLSLQNLRQEQEKQAILSSQKNLLEQQVQERTAELYQQKKELQTTLEHLKDTQLQLIQREKMASLGEVTAGIAHEIQNPLNFVNNFSEVNKELLVEMNEEIDKGNFGEVKTIAKDVIDNQEKINHHGRRADAIVKGMLQHSRISTGQKELTDINALCDEYLRLSYHGLRAKDKSFNAKFEMNFDPSIEKLNIVPQEMGRVILNLINNAFYAVTEKKKSGIENYEPTVSVSTRKINGKVEIKVSDNGNGIPQKVLDKIFQPFFTTKPTGQGTGLGLSLSYDIVKAHGGEINVYSKDGEGAEFRITLPENR